MGKCGSVPNRIGGLFMESKMIPFTNNLQRKITFAVGSKTARVSSLYRISQRFDSQTAVFWIQNETVMQAELVSRGPLSVVFDASMLQFYHSGVWDPWVCSRTSLDHGGCLLIINPRRACAARVTAVGSVCLLLSISLLECSFVSQTIRRP